MIEDNIREALHAAGCAAPLREMIVRPRLCGVYCLVLGSSVVYVGQSTDLEARANSHLQERSKGFDRILVFECDEADLDRLEYSLIERFRPRYNGSAAAGTPPGPSRAARVALVRQAVKEIARERGPESLTLGELTRLVRMRVAQSRADSGLVFREAERSGVLTWDPYLVAYLYRPPEITDG